MLERYLIGLGGRLVRFEGADDESRMAMYSISGLSAEVTAPRRGRGK